MEAHAATTSTFSLAFVAPASVKQSMKGSRAPFLRSFPSNAGDGIMIPISHKGVAKPSDAILLKKAVAAPISNNNLSTSIRLRNHHLNRKRANFQSSHHTINQQQSKILQEQGSEKARMGEQLPIHKYTRTHADAASAPLSLQPSRPESHVEEHVLSPSGQSSYSSQGAVPFDDMLASSGVSTELLSRASTTTSTRRGKGWHLPYSVTIKALRTYYMINGDLVMPRRYIVTSTTCDDNREDGYPLAWNGLDLAGTVYNMKWWQQHVKERPHRVSELNQLGFVWERLQPEWNLVLVALVTYQSLHGNVLVPLQFVVPREDVWPKATWGLSLGSCVHRIRLRHDFLGQRNYKYSRRQQLDALGFVWDVSEHRFKIFYLALRHFAKLQGSGAYSNSISDVSGIPRSKALRVPTTFIVPSNKDWPRELWGYPLGAKCTAIRQKELYVKNHPERLYLLQELGFRGTGNASLGWLKVVHAAAIYSRLHGRLLDVPYHFVVPAPQAADGSVTQECVEEWPWPEHLWGFRLGQRLKDIRVKGAYIKGETGTERLKQLEALGFNWNPKRGRRKASMDE